MTVEFFYCSCCGYKTVTDTHDICRICLWEWDEAQDRDPDSLGANRVTLRMARANFEIYGACDEDALEHVSPAGDDDERDPNWPAWPKREPAAELLVAASTARVRREKLSDAEVEEQLKKARSGSEREREIALDVLCGHIDAHDVDPPEVFDAWLDVVRETARECFPGSRLGYVAVNHWMRHELDGACRFVLDEVSVEERSEAEWRALADVLIRLTSFPEVVARLKALAGGEGPAAEWATHVLELEGVVPREKVEAMAVKWRASRSFKALLEIYENYICRIAPATVERSSLIELLGPPSGVRDSLVWYDDESSQAALFLESDDRGRLIASRASWEGYRPAFRFE